MPSVKCTHEVQALRFKLETDYEGETEEVEYTEILSTYVDIDLHRYTCSHCGIVKYYSNAAREFFEEGVTSNIDGLQQEDLDKINALL